MVDNKKHEVEPSGENIRTIFDYHGDISSFIDWAEEKSMTVKKLEDEYQDVSDSVKVYSAGKVKFVAAEKGDFRDVLLIRTSKDDTTVDDYLERGKFAQINHGKEEFTIRAFDVVPGWYMGGQKKYSKRTKIIAKCEIFDMADYEEQLMPDTNYKFYHDKKQVATMFLGYWNEEMTDVNPTIHSFDVEGEGEEYKKMIIRGVEERLGKQGFKKIWITNYIGYPPPSDFWRKMGYKFDIDEGCKSLKKYQLKPLPKWTDKLCAEIVEMEDQEKQIELLERLPENDQTRLLKASILNELGDHEEAIECCDRTVEQFPYSTRFDEGVQSVKAEALEKLGRHEEAIKCWDKNIKHFEKVFKNDSKRFWGKFANSLYDKARVLEEIGRYDESIKLYEKLVEIEKADKNYSDQYGSEHWWWSYVNKLNGLGRHEEALKVCDDVIGYDPTESAIWEQKVDTLKKLGRYEEALKCWDKVIEIEVKNENDYTYYYASKAKILNLLGRHEEALKCVDEANTSVGHDDPVEEAELFFQKSEALDRLARYEEAIECLDEIIKSFNDTEIVDGRPKDAWKRKARLLRDSGRHEEYKKCREEMKKLFSTAEQKYY